jgi:hypothetical protein
MRRRYPRYYESYTPRFYDPYDKRFYPSNFHPSNVYPTHQPYTGLHFVGDLIMLTLTGGLWFIYIFVREMRRR